MPRWSLHRRLQTVHSLTQSWEDIRSAHPDSREVQEFSTNSRYNLKQLSQSLKSGQFAFGQYRGRVLHRKNKLRPIMEPKIRAKIVQKSLLRLIYPGFRRQLENDVSFGSIKDKNIEQAIRQIVQLRQSGHKWVFESDIIRFFDRIDRSALLQQVLSSLPDQTINVLLIDAVNAELENADDLEEYAELFPGPEAGIPQGSILSPFFANLYLSSFDQSMISRGVHAIRYVDDFVVLCQTQQQAIEVYKFVGDLLAKLKLKIHPIDTPNENGKIKTGIIPYDQGFEFLGITLAPTRLQPSEQKICSFNDRIEELTDYGNPLGLSLLERLQKLNRVINGWGNAYRFCNMPPIFSTMDKKIAERVSVLLRHELSTPTGTLSERKIRSIGIRQLADIRLRPIFGSPVRTQSGQAIGQASLATVA